jgi:3-deoxy-D-manno-octulosonate 8-phosphate phosphatase KdsC-like HAD superfamily phosphatase
MKGDAMDTTGALGETIVFLDHFQSLPDPRQRGKVIYPLDELGDIVATLDAETFQQCFVAWMASLTGAPAEVIAIDGKTLRRSYQETGKKAAIHMVSAFAARQRLVLGQVKVAAKSNEIVAIPKLLDMLAIDGAIVTIDAMGCQRDIAKQIIDQKADYVLALKGNQGTLREDVEILPRSASSA